MAWWTCPAVLRERPDGLRALAIDIPIGLLVGPRDCDTARRLLGSPRACSVFSAPCREALSAVDYAAACGANEARTGRRLSQQSWAIARKIKEVDDVIERAHQQWAFEVHPEVCFWNIAGKRAMAHRKKSSAGRNERSMVLSDHVPRIGEYAARKPKGIAADDLLDAAVAALTARRWLQGKADRVCEPQLDPRGLRVEIVY